MPIPVIIAIVGHAIFILMRAVSVMNNLDLVVIQNIPIIILTGATHVLGIIGLLLRKKWIRKYTYVLFGFYLVMHILQMDKVLKEFDPLGITWSVIVITLSLYIFHQFYTEPAVKAYLTK